MSHLIHCGLIFEAIVQPEGSDELIKSLDAATQADSAKEEGLGRFGGAVGARGREGRWLLLWPGFLVDVREDVDLVEAEAELAQ